MVVDVVDVVVVVVVVVVVGGVAVHDDGSGAVTAARTVLVTVPSWLSKIGPPVRLVSSNTIGVAALAPATVPWVDVVPLKRYWPEPSTVPSLPKFVPPVKPEVVWL